MTGSVALDIGVIETELRAQYDAHPLEHTKFAIALAAEINSSDVGCITYRRRLLVLSDTIKNIQLVYTMEGRVCGALDQLTVQLDAATKWMRAWVGVWTTCNVMASMVTGRMTRCASHCKRGI
jgi:hypothetical protein